MSNEVQGLWILGGVTASGKTELSLRWAERNNAEIISCDTVSMYRGLDIGSAKPDALEQQRVAHYGLDLADISEVFDVGQFHAYAKRIVHDIISRGKKVLVVGGSGFFLDGFLRPVVDLVVVSKEIRKQVNSIFEQDGLPAAIQELNKLNPKGLGNLDLKNPLRVTRALERCLQSGRSLHDLRNDFEKVPAPYGTFPKKMLWLNRGDDELMERINLRTQQMLSRGMIEETERAIRAGIERHPSLAKSVGYKEVIEFLQKGGSRKDLMFSIAKSTRQLVSKQRKWFRKNFPEGSRLELNSTNSMHSDDLPWVAGT